jgi:hypothetical protein
MKVCPECGTQYEDHVPTCIADGATLVAKAVAPSQANTEIRPRAATPPPAAPRRQGIGGFPLVLLAVMLLAGGATMSVVAVAVASSRLARPPAVAEPVRPRPVTLPPDPVPVEPEEQPPVEVMLVSEPLGAEVFENDQFVCQTPCTIQHPPHAPLPRIFVFKAEGHRDDTFEMTEAKGPIAVALHRLRVAPAPSAPSSTAPRPTIGRDR